MSEQESASQTQDETPPGNGTAIATEGAGSLHDQVIEALKKVYDPELGINVVDLGLVYSVELSESGDVDVTYTLTTMGCPIGPMIEDQMRTFVQAVEGIGDVRPEMVLRPAWSPEMMSDEAKAALGVF